MADAGPFPVIRTERLLLRAFTAGDAPDVERLAGAREVASTTLNIPHPYPEGTADGWIAGQEEARRRGAAIVFAITQREGGDLIGAISMRIDQANDRAEIGYWIGVPYWGSGYGTEANIAVVDYAFCTLRLNRVHAYHFKRNPASGRVLQKSGMAYEGRLRKHVRKLDAYEDLEIYGVLAAEWMKPQPPSR